MTNTTGTAYVGPTLNAPVEILDTTGPRYRVRTLPGGTGGWATPGKELFVDPSLVSLDDEAVPAEVPTVSRLDGPISAEDYMQVLLARQAAWHANHPRIKLPALLEWFIEPGDEQHVQLPEPTPRTERPKPTPRTYRSAASLRAERDQLETKMAAVAGANDIGDRAATNLSPYSRSRSAARAGRRRFAAMDRALERYTALEKRRDALNGQIARAEARERQTKSTPSNPAA